MNSFKKFLYLTLGAVVLVVIGLIVINNYSLIFQRHVSGEIIGMERVAPGVTVLNGQGGASTPGMFSFAVAIRDETGLIHTASTEDRQWAIARPGFCADAIFYPYPFWNFEKSGTYMNARLIQLRDCAKGTTLNGGAPVGTPGAQGVATPSPDSTPAMGAGASGSGAAAPGAIPAQ